MHVRDFQGVVYEVSVVEWLGGPLAIVLPGVVLVVGSGNDLTDIEHAQAVLGEVPPRSGL